jgi:hypothetical protein
MKRPRQGIRSTHRKNAIPSSERHTLANIDNEVEHKNFNYGLERQLMPHTGANVITDDDSPMDANLFCFAAFADKNTGTIYNDLTGLFPFMSLKGNICFLVVYHYETNAILALPIAGFSNGIILAAYKQQHKLLESKGFNIKLNAMDNQASRTIKKYLTLKQCDQMLVELHNHRVNAAEQAIQRFKAHFISALATTDSELPLQLWDRHTPQVESTLNMLRPSRIDPSKSAYEAMNGP